MFKKKKKKIHSHLKQNNQNLSCYASVPSKVIYVHRCLTSSRWDRTSLSIDLSFDVQHQQLLKKSVPAVRIVCAELGLPAGCDGCPDSTQHATSETAVLDRFECSVTNERCQTPPRLFDGTQNNEVDEVRLFCTTTSEGNPFLHFCIDGWCEGDVWWRLTLFHSTSSHPWRPCRWDSPRWTHERATRKQDHTGVVNPHSGYMSNTKQPQVLKKKEEFTLSIVFWSTGIDLSQSTKAFTSGSELVREANSPSIMDID